MGVLGTIGAGFIATVIAQLAVPTDWRVVMSNSRGPQSLQGVVAELGEHVSAGSIDDAAAADIVVVTIPLGRLAELPTDLLDGKIVIDTMNYYPQRDGAIADLDEARTTTSLMVAEHFAGARVVKGFNNIVFSHLRALARPVGASDRSTLPIAGDDAEAKTAAAALISELGFDTLDTGSLAASWRFERDQPAYVLPYAADPEALRASVPGNRPKEARRADAVELAAALARARRF